MEHLHSQVQTGPGDCIRVDLDGTEANVLIMDAVNYSFYRRGGRYSYFGGHYNRTPAIIQPPHAGRWDVVIDLGGGRGQVRAAVSVV